jgi:hypothetical protein
MTQPIFPNDDAILKYNIDKNGLYMNSEFGEYGYTSPYYGVSANETGFIPTFHISAEIRNKIINHPNIQVAIKRGCEWFEPRAFPIRLKTYNDPLKAAYISQLFRFGDDTGEKIIALTYHTFIEADEEVEKWLNEFPDFIYEPVELKHYLDHIDDYKQDQKLVDAIKLKKINDKQEKEKRKQIDKNKKEFLARMEKYAQKIHYKYDVMTEELALELMKKKFN